MLKRISYLSVPLFICLSFWFSFLSPNLVFARECGDPDQPPCGGGGGGGGGIINPALTGDLGSGNPENVLGRYLSSWWGVFFIAAAIAFILYLAWGALEWAISGSSEDRVSNAKNKIQNALVGLTILAVSWALVRLLGYVLGIDILETLQFNTSRLAP